MLQAAGTMAASSYIAPCALVGGIVGAGYLGLKRLTSFGK